MAFQFSKQSIGLRITEDAVTGALLEKRWRRAEVRALARVLIKPGVVRGGEVGNKPLLEAACKRVFEEICPEGECVPLRSIVFAPPAELFITRLMVMPRRRSKGERDAAFQEAAEKELSFHKDGLSYVVEVLEEEDDYMRAMFVGASARVLSAWDVFFRGLGAHIAHVDFSPFASVRGLFVHSPQPAKCFVDIQKGITTVSIFYHGGLEYYKAVVIDMSELPKAVQKAEDMEARVKSEEMHGITVGMIHKKVFPPIMGVAASLVKEILSAVKTFEERTGEETVSEVLFIGIGSQSSVFVDIMQSQLGIWARAGKSRVFFQQTKKPRGNAIPSDQRKKETKKETAADLSRHITAIGLALRPLERIWSGDPAFLIEKRELSPALRVLRAFAVLLGRLGNGSAVWLHHGTERFLGPAARRSVLLPIIVIAVLLAGGLMAYRGILVRDASHNDTYDNVLKNTTQSATPDEGEVVDKTPAKSLPTVPTVTITETPTGWLNVRNGPGLSYEILRKVLPGEQYEIIGTGKDGKWYKIKIGKENEGWIYAFYTEMASGE